MGQSVPCCRDPGTLTAVKSPFTKILALDFYDGPTGGLLQCETCGAVYRFDMLDWDDNHEIRIFRLASLPADSMEKCVRMIAGTETPHWPLWAPFFRTSPSDEHRKKLDDQLQAILDQAKPAELVVAWSGYGECILAAKKISARELVVAPNWFSVEDLSQMRDWFSLLGLVKGKRVIFQ